MHWQGLDSTGRAAFGGDFTISCVFYYSIIQDPTSNLYTSNSNEMRKFLSLLVLFLLPGFIFAYLLDRFVSKNLAKSNKEAVGEYQVWNDIYEGKAGSDIVIYGSSRAWVHFDPLIIGDSLKMSAYNLGIDGHGFWLQYLRHLEYSKYNRRPKLTVLSVDILTLQKRKELYNYSQFLPYALYNKNVRDFTSSFQGFSMPDFYFPLLRFTRLKGS